MENETLLTGIPSFDFLICDGIPRGAAIVVEGPPGIGKTTFGIQYLYEGICTYDEPGVFISFEELPTQIYRDMGNYGWNLKELEEQNKLRVISISPDTFLRELIKPQGLVETVLTQLGCKRVVIDSISLFKYGSQDEKVQRETIYSIHNAFSKYAITALYLREKGNRPVDVPFVHFIMDGVIELSYHNGVEHSRQRVLEIKKMRGTKFVEGDHLFRILQDGIRILRTKRVPEKASGEVTTTGISSLDHYLGGGIVKGSTWLFDVDTTSSYRELITTILAYRAKSGENFMCRLSPSGYIKELDDLMSIHGVSIEALAKEDRLFLYEQFGREMPKEYQNFVTPIHNISNDDYLSFILNHSNLLERTKNGEFWFLYYDINASIAGRGKRFVMSILPKIISFQREMGLTAIVLCNTKQIDEDMHAVLERSSDGVIRLWAEEYQYMKIDKSPNGLVSEPLVIEKTTEYPYIEIL